MDWILALALATFVLVVAGLAWSHFSAKRHSETGGAGSSTGVGGPNDPISGSTPGVRSGPEIQASMNQAAAQSHAGAPVYRQE